MNKLERIQSQIDAGTYSVPADQIADAILTPKPHGHCGNGRGDRSPTYNSWRAMIQRCTSVNHEQYPNYGGRGIKFHPSWKSFSNFLSDMGRRPANKTLDRIDVNGDYGPDNCKWSTAKQQARNKRQTGMTLVSTLIAVGIMGVLAAVMVDLSIMMIKNNTTAFANSDILAYVNEIRLNMQSPDRATAMLAGNSLSGNIMLHDPLIPSSIIAQADFKQTPTDAWKVKRIIFDNVTPTGEVDTFRLTVVGIFEKDNIRTVGPNIARRIIGDVYCLAPANVIETCNVSSPIATPTPMPSPTTTPSPTSTPNIEHGDSKGRREGDQHYGHSHSVGGSCSGH